MIKYITIFFFLFTLFFSELFALGTSPTQGNWQWRNDDGTESGATGISGEQTEITITDFSNKRIRIELYDFWGGLGSGDNTQYYALLYSVDSTNWVQITSDATSNAFALSLSPYFTDGDTTTEIITSSLSNFQSGNIFESSSSFIYTLNANTSTQFEFCIKPTSNVQAITRYTFSLGYASSGTGPFTAYGSNYPTLLTDSAVPVELTDFTAKVIDKKVILIWETATEVNNYGFDIERSLLPATHVRTNYESEDASWETIGFVSGHGNSNSPNNYSFTDDNPPGGQVSYRLKQIDFDGIYEYSDVIAVKVEMPTEMVLNQNFPNPFNPSTTIEYYLPSTYKLHVVQLKVYDLLGRVVATLVDEQQQPGKYKVLFDASGLPSGTYIYRLTAGGLNQSKKLILLK